MDEEIAIEEALSDTQARFDAADDSLDEFASIVFKAALTLTMDDKKHPLVRHLFGGKSLSEFQKPKMGPELDAMKAWVDTFASGKFPALQALATELEARITVADTASAARTAARVRNRQFRDVGARAQIFEKLNVGRTTVQAALTKVGLETPGLSPRFASRFFRSTPTAAIPDPTIETVTDELADLQSKIDAAKKLLEDLKAAQADEAKAAADRQRKETQLEDLRAKMDEMAKEASALAAEITP